MYYTVKKLDANVNQLIKMYLDDQFNEQWKRALPCNCKELV